MNPLLFMFLSSLVFTGTTKEYSKLPLTINNEKEEKEKEAASNTKHIIIQPTIHKVFAKKDIPAHRLEASDHNKSNNTLKLHKSLQGLREYLEELTIKKAAEEQSGSSQDPSAEYSKLPLTINNEKKEKEKEASSNTKHIIIQPTIHEVFAKKDIPAHQLEASDHIKNNDTLKLHKSLQSLREYLEELSMKKAAEEQSGSSQEPSEDDEFGPHYHIMNTNEPPMDIPLEGLQDNDDEHPPKDLFFHPIPLSDKKGDVLKRIQLVSEEAKPLRETLLLGVSSATLVILLLLTVFCAVTIYQCSKQYRYWDTLSFTSSEQRALFAPLYFQPLEGVSDSTISRTQSFIWNEPPVSMLHSEAKQIKTLSFAPMIQSIDEVATFSDESARTFERDRSAEQSETEHSEGSMPVVPKITEAAPPPSAPVAAAAAPTPAPPEAAPAPAPPAPAPPPAPPAPAPPPAPPAPAPAPAPAPPAPAPGPPEAAPAPPAPAPAPAAPAPAPAAAPPPPPPVAAAPPPPPAPPPAPAAPPPAPPPS